MLLNRLPVWVLPVVWVVVPDTTPYPFKPSVSSGKECFKNLLSVFFYSHTYKKSHHG